MERFFPGFATALDQAGAPSLRWLTDVNLYLSNGWLKRNDLNIITRTTTRPNLEWIVRQELAKLANVTFVDNCQVNGLVTDTSRTRLTGLNISYRRAVVEQDNQAEVLEADLIVDASGRNSKFPEWLKTIGYESPAETQVNSKLGYASCLYSKLSYEPDWKFIGINAKAPDQPRGGSISHQEGGQWMVTLMGYGEQHQPPTDLDGFLAFAKGMPSPEIYDALKTATPLSAISGYADTMNVWHHYEKLKQMPQSMIVLGDAVCCFNPIYGQGMTTAALAAETLNTCLSQRKPINGLGMSFQKQLAKVIANPWLLATGADFQFPETEGKRPGGLAGVAQAYFERLLQLTYSDPQVAKAFIENPLSGNLRLRNRQYCQTISRRSPERSADQISAVESTFVFTS